MGSVVATMSMSLDGFVAGPDDEVDDVFAWYGTAPVIEPCPTGALICGRRLFELTDAWGGRHPMGAHVFVVTHRVPAGWPRAGAPFTFVTDGVVSAVRQAKELAGDRDVALATPTITRQCVDLGLVDVIAVDLVPLLLGEGIPLFSGLAKAPVALDTPTVREAEGVTHLRFAVRNRLPAR
ncbi:dihydrofolate reductase family protein [Pseudonocardia sp. TRM90224]|uniref:dihydrofolate reductase family protein n=1 Tax=Pseudonocardia sp. TRM90224 TaxID=2812678 RepID=UPI001E4327F1|nr:dihydrofolate reductase family protein [Pseudonocardia sp. TRM90224]